MYRFVQGLFLCFALIIPGCGSSPLDESKAEDTSLSLSIEREQAPGVSLQSREVTSFEQRDVWCRLAMRFVERWSANEPLTREIENKVPGTRRQASLPLMPCLGVFKKLPDWMDHQKVFEPRLGKFVRAHSFSVKEVEEPEENAPEQSNVSGAVRNGLTDGPRYYLEAIGEWEHGTATLRFSFSEPKSKFDVIWITGFWLIPDTNDPPLPGARSNGYIIGQDMMCLAGYPERSQIRTWRRAGVFFSRKGWASNFFLPVYIDLWREQEANAFPSLKVSGRNRQFHNGWRVKWWFDPTTCSLTSQRSSVVIDGKRWVQYYDPAKTKYQNNDSILPPFEATPGDYRFSIEIPESELLPFDPHDPGRKKAKPIDSDLMIFSDVISIDNSTRTLNVVAIVPESVQRQRRAILHQVTMESAKIVGEPKQAVTEPGHDSQKISGQDPVQQLETLLHRLHHLGKHQCVAGLSYETRTQTGDAPKQSKSAKSKPEDAKSKAIRPEDVTEIDLYAEFSIGCDCCSDGVCSEVTDSDLSFFGAFRSLEVLRIPWAHLEGPGLVFLKDLKNLRELELSCNPLDDRSLSHLSGLENLETLYLCRTNIHGTGLRYLKKLPKLKRLYLNGCYLSPEGWAALGELSQLEHLGVTALKCGDGPTDKYLCHLAKLQNLKTISLNTKAVTLRDRINLEHFFCRKGHLAYSEMIELVDNEDLMLWLGKLSKLSSIGLPFPGKGIYQASLRHFSDPTIPEFPCFRLNIASDGPIPINELTKEEVGCISKRLDAIEYLEAYVEHSPETSKSDKTAEIGGMKSLQKLSIGLEDDVTELFIHDMPNLKKLTIWIRRQYTKPMSAASTFIVPEVKIGCLRLENLPQLSSVKSPNPSKLSSKNVPDVAIRFLHEQK